MFTTFVTKEKPDKGDSENEEGGGDDEEDKEEKEFLMKDLLK